MPRRSPFYFPRSPRSGRAALPLIVAVLLGSTAMTSCSALTGQSPSSTPAPPSGAGSAGATPSGTAKPTTTDCQYDPNGQPSKAVNPPPGPGIAQTGKAVFDLTTNEGRVRITMDRTKAPCTVNSFASLVSQKFYDQTRCHRLVDSGIFVLQCGDPTGTGTGGPGYTFADELDGSETYPAGTVAMANSGPNTNGSQFFLVFASTPLPPMYTVFGRLDKASLGVVNRIQAEGEDGSYGNSDGKPNNPAQIVSVRQVS